VTPLITNDLPTGVLFSTREKQSIVIPTPALAKNEHELIYLDRLLTTLFNNNTKKLLDDLSNESSTNSSGFHSKSTTTLFNNEYSSKLNETNGFTFSGKITYK